MLNVLGPLAIFALCILWCFAFSQNYKENRAKHLKGDKDEK